MRFIAPLFRATTVAAMFFLLAGTAHAQFLDEWVNYKWKDVPRTADGKVNLNAPTPKTATRAIRARCARRRSTAAPST